FLIIKNIEFNKMDFFILLSFLIYSFTDNTIMNYRYWIPFSVIILSLLLKQKKPENNNKYLSQKGGS
ncbi:hypothetical protein, partial [Oenococcus oeni]